VLSGEPTNTNCLVFGFNLGYTALKVRTLAITQSMRLNNSLEVITEKKHEKKQTLPHKFVSS